MMRSKTSSAMQKCYDDAYLQSSTAVYFESQNNEAEALRSWRQALDTIYYHNAYRVPANYRPRSEVEKALQDSLRQMELQCKERVDLLEALKRSREEAEPDKEAGKPVGLSSGAGFSTGSSNSTMNNSQNGGLGEGTVSPLTYPELLRPPPLPQRPEYTTRSGSSASNTQSYPHGEPSLRMPQLTPVVSLPTTKSARTPSPEKKKTGMLRTLRSGGRDKEAKRKSTSGLDRKHQPPAATNAASLAWTALPQTINPRTGQMQGSETVPGGHLPSSAAAVASASKGKQTSWTRPAKLPRSTSHDKDGWYDVDDSTHTSERRRSRTQAQNITRASVDEAQELKSSAKPLPNDARRTQTPPRNPSLTLPKINSDVLSYRKEYPSTSVIPNKYPAARPPVATSDFRAAPSQSPRTIQRKELANKSILGSSARIENDTRTSFENEGDVLSHRKEERRKDQWSNEFSTRESSATPVSSDAEDEGGSLTVRAWQERVNRVMKQLPKGVDDLAAKQIFNEIVIQGDEVHWDDIAGLEVAKAALKETVVYPFLRPDLFMGLREPARGMLLFGPPGTGKTMLARAVATESKSTFFAISASSLTSKYLGDSEKLVRALFALARALAPSIIFVDEIDSLLSVRSGSGEHEATRRIKTEFLIQWSDLAKAAAGRETSERDRERGDASRVLVLAATNLPWAIDEAARRRFVRRQYIPLPEGHVRRQQLQTLLSHQKCKLSATELDKLVKLTDGFSGSDITALAKDAAMGPLRSLGEKLLQMTKDEIRPITFVDFQASLVNIRPSVSTQGLKEYEDWAREFGERGG